VLGRVFGFRDLAGNIAYVVAFLGASALLSTVGVRAVFAVGGVMLLALVPLAALLFRPSPPARSDRRDTMQAVPEPV
jgi:MFS family permease